MAPLRLNGQASVVTGDISSQRLRLLYGWIANGPFNPAVPLST
jgi:hypothetical protein